MARESKKRSKNHQVGRRQYKVRMIEKPLLLSRTSATSTPRTTITTTTTGTLPTMSNSVITTTTWPSTTSTMANLFVSNSSNTLRTPHIPNPQIPMEWNTASPKSNPGLSHKEDTPMPTPEEKQKVRKLDLSKLRSPPIREITSSHPKPPTTNTPTTPSITVTADTPSPAKMCKRWGPPCPFCAQSTPHPSPVDSDWSEED